MKGHRHGLASASLVAALAAASICAAAPKFHSGYAPGYSKDFKFEPDRDVALDAAVGWVRFEGLKIETKQKKSGLLVRTIVLVHSKADDDVQAIVTVKFHDKDGNILGTAIGNTQIEDGDDGKVEAEVILSATPSEITGYTIELDASNE